MVGCDFFLQIAGPITGRLIGGGQNLRSDVILFLQVNVLIAGGLISGGRGNVKSDWPITGGLISAGGRGT